MGTQKEINQLEHGLQVGRLMQERDNLTRELNGLRAEYEELCLVFKNVGLGKDSKQWKKGINKLKHEVGRWKKDSEANKTRVNTLLDKLHVVEMQCRDIMADLEFERTKQGALGEYIRMY